MICIISNILKIRFIKYNYFFMKLSRWNQYLICSHVFYYILFSSMLLYRNTMTFPAVWPRGTWWCVLCASSWGKRWLTEGLRDSRDQATTSSPLDRTHSSDVPASRFIPGAGIKLCFSFRKTKGSYVFLFERQEEVNFTLYVYDDM